MPKIVNLQYYYSFSQLIQQTNATVLLQYCVHMCRYCWYCRNHPGNSLQTVIKLPWQPVPQYKPNLGEFGCFGLHLTQGCNMVLHPSIPGTWQIPLSVLAKWYILETNKHMGTLPLGGPQLQPICSKERSCDFNCFFAYKGTFYCTGLHKFDLFAIGLLTRLAMRLILQLWSTNSPAADQSSPWTMTCQRPQHSLKQKLLEAPITLGNYHEQ